MMSDSQRFPFREMSSEFGAGSSMPYLPLVLNYLNQSLNVTGLLDTGATVNVLPYDTGVQLGANWEQQKTIIRLTGNLAQLEARGIIVSATIGKFESVRLAFAWTKANNIPVILGQVNFFLEFDVCFYRSQSIFEVRPKTSFKA